MFTIYQAREHGIELYKSPTQPPIRQPTTYRKKPKKKHYQINNLSITDHALKRYQQRYCPSATRADIAEALQNAKFVCKGNQNADIVSADGYAWVIKKNNKKSVVVTVLPYYRKNQEFWEKREVM